MTKVTISGNYIFLHFLISTAVAFWTGRYAGVNTSFGIGFIRDVPSSSSPGASVNVTRTSTYADLNMRTYEDKHEEGQFCHRLNMSKDKKSCYIEMDTDIDSDNQYHKLHLFVKIKFEGKSSSLQPTSETHLKALMMEIMTQDSNLSVLSHEQCSTMEGQIGITCLGILANSHISLTTMSKDRIMTFSIFKHASKAEMMQILMLIQDQLGIKYFKEGDHEDRSFIWWSMKKQHSHHFVDESKTSPIAHECDEVYYEAFVHPIMFAHEWPERIAIVGGDSSSRANSNSRRCWSSCVLSEVLKHSSLSNLKIFLNETSDYMQQKKYDHQYFDNNEQVEFNPQDALSWFNKRFLESNITKNHDSNSKVNQELFDVVLMDTLTLHPKTADELWYTNENFMKSLYNSLSDKGSVVFQLGMIPKSIHLHGTTPKHWVKLLSLIEKCGYESIRIYSERKKVNQLIHDKSSSLFGFIVAMKSDSNKKGWYDDANTISLKILHRIGRTNGESSMLKQFDSSAMMKYQIPHKVFESIYCLSEPDFCYENMHGRFNKDIPLSEFEVKMSTIGEGSGRGLFSTTDIKEGSSIGLQDAQYPIYFNPNSLNSIETFDIDSVFNYADGYGWTTSDLGSPAYYVEPNILTFVNHGCNGTFNVADPSVIENTITGKMLTEQNAKISDFPPLPPLYSPYYDRHMQHDQSSGIIALQDISAGDEIFSDYLFYSLGSPEEFYEEVQVLKRICSGEEIGLISISEGFGQNK